MSTSIEWTERTWNPLRGCSMAKGSETGGCLNCYAARIAARYGRNPESAFAGYAVFRDSGPRWTGKVDLIESKLKEPLSWRKPSVVFANSMSDLFHESLRDDEIDRVFAVMALAGKHTFQVLTKRSRRMRGWFAGTHQGCPDDKGRTLTLPKKIRIRDLAGMVLAPPWPLPNLWLGVSVENRANKYRIDDLRATPAAVRFLSLEPLLEDIGELNLDGIRWVIIGGESGPGARPFDIAWARDIIKQCVEAGVACFVKQLGAKPRWSLTNHLGQWAKHVRFVRETSREAPYHWDNIKLKNKKGGEMAEWPEDLRVREMPS